MSSKIFKFYSRIIGLPYLYDVLAKYVQQIEEISRRKEDNENGEMGILDVDIEVDTQKGEGVDADSNSMQLQFICSRILSSIFKSVAQIPKEFKLIFISIRQAINEKFGEESDTIYFAVGGLFFLRFLGPSIFAPHVYGLMENPPCPGAQRQLVLIAKVLQSIANMVMPGIKEEYMGKMSAFVNKQIPKIKEFYNNILSNPEGPVHTNYNFPEEMVINARINIYNSFYNTLDSVKNKIGELTTNKDLYYSQIENIISTYGEPPKKAKVKERKESKLSRKESKMSRKESKRKESKKNINN